MALPSHRVDDAAQTKARPDVCTKTAAHSRTVVSSVMPLSTQYPKYNLHLQQHDHSTAGTTHYSLQVLILDNWKCTPHVLAEEANVASCSEVLKDDQLESTWQGVIKVK
jgi:hypothetical protein